jgi:SAM-dependent methyltransferase
MKINLGCGNKVRPGYVGVDRYFCAAARVLCDIDRSLPFRDSSIDEVHLDNVIEHVADIAQLVRELVRVAKDGATLTIVTPHFSSLASWRDPTHRYHLSYFSMDHFEGKYLREDLQGRVVVSERHLSFGGGLLGILGRLCFLLSPEFYERKVCFVFRASTLRFALHIEKGQESPDSQRPAANVACAGRPMR